MEEKTLFRNVHVRQSPQGHGREPEAHHPPVGEGGEGVQMRVMGSRATSSSGWTAIRLVSYTVPREEKKRHSRDEIMKLRAEDASTSSKS